MQYTAAQRRTALLKMAQEDPELFALLAENEAARGQFTRFVDKLPWFMRKRLWGYPGILYFLHSRMLAFVCTHMRFPEEDT